MSMNKYATVVTDSMILVIDTTTGEEVKFFSTDVQFSKALEMVKKGDFKSVFTLEVKSVVTSFFAGMKDAMKTVTVAIENGVGYITMHKFGDLKVPMNDAVTAKILTMSKQGFDCKPLVNFLSNLYTNPSKTAIDELYLFIEACNLPITEDGHFIAYKIVKNDYMDAYTGKIRNMIGDKPAMPRAMVDDDRNRTCSQGLHFCSKEYLSHYGSGNRATDRCMLVKINPADVVAIPSDYNNAKGRTWTYEVVGEVESGWRATLPSADYTTKAVVDTTGNEIKDSVAEKVKEIVGDFLDCTIEYLELEDDIRIDLGADDLDMVEIIMEVEDSFGIELNENLSSTLRSIGHLVEAVKYETTPKAAPVAPVASTTTTDAFKKGYLTGFTHGKNKYNKMALIAGSDYANGYDRGYKDGKNKKAKMFKD